jgi:hypothetical protein
MCADGFFPPGSLDSRTDLHASRGSRYASYLATMGEKPLYPPLADSPPTYRLLYLPTFREPLVVRVTEATHSWRVVCKRSDGLGGYFTGQLVGSGERSLSRAEVKQFRRRLDRVGFWEMPSFDGVFGLDGTRCVIEGMSAGRYHVVDRWSPCGTPYAELVKFLVGVSRGIGEAQELPQSFRSFAELVEGLYPQPKEGG